MRQTVYIETSVVSYYTSRPSRDLVVAAHQQITQQWWNERLNRYDALVSALVLREASEGDANAVRKRLHALRSFAVLTITPEAERLAQIYLDNIPQLRTCIRDALHLAIASAGGVDYLVTWNCSHIARADIRKAVEAENDALGVDTPIICTPEELLEV